MVIPLTSSEEPRRVITNPPAAAAERRIGCPVGVEPRGLELLWGIGRRIDARIAFKDDLAVRLEGDFYACGDVTGRDVGVEYTAAAEGGVQGAVGRVADQ